MTCICIELSQPTRQWYDHPVTVCLNWSISNDTASITIAADGCNSDMDIYCATWEQTTCHGILQHPLASRLVSDVDQINMFNWLGNFSTAFFGCRIFYFDSNWEYWDWILNRVAIFNHMFSVVSLRYSPLTPFSNFLFCNSISSRR